MKTVNCNLCNSNHYEFLFYGKDRQYKIDNKKFNIVKCSNCGLVFINPQPSVQELIMYYSENYQPYQNGSPQGILKYNAFFKKIRNIKRRFHFNHLKKRESDYDTKAINFLDFGCGGGNYLQRVKEKHPRWNLYGLDNNEYACKKAQEKGFKIFCDKEQKAALTDHFFDVIYMGHVIEHLNDPQSTLRRLHKSLKTDGRLIIKTPNFDSFSAKIFKSYWFALEIPRHLYFFTIDTLKQMLDMTGFEVMNIVYDKGPKVFIKSIFHILNKKDYRINPLVWSIFIPFSRLSSLLGKSSNIMVYARKK